MRANCVSCGGSTAGEIIVKPASGGSGEQVELELALEWGLELEAHEEEGESEEYAVKESGTELETELLELSELRERDAPCRAAYTPATAPPSDWPTICTRVFAGR